ncbi:acyltransferase [Polaribacter atrinae]|uniref:acyltransferase n=1 Tax=Polaribacter atrinae TaxID=1333662 RepID=UPI0030FB910E
MIRFLKNIIVYLLPYRWAYKQFTKASLQASYIDFLKFKFGINKRYWPAHQNCIIANEDKIFIGINSLVGRPGNYIQGGGEVYIGNYVRFAVNVGILSVNHDLYDQRLYNRKKVIIGNYTWVGMNSVILPGVELGVRTIVAAGSVVTKSFPEGYCVIGGTPAKIIKKLDKEKFIPWKDEMEFYGFVSKEEFEKKYSKRFLKLKNIYG